MKKEKGSVTLFVSIACVFMIMILLMVNIGVINKNRNQEKELEEIAKQYNQNEIDLDTTYAKVADENGYVTVKDVQEMIDENLLKQYPIGSIYITTNEQNPSEYIGGEWESYGEGRTIVGAGTGIDENNIQKVFEINQTGGEYQHTLTINEMPSHNHYLRKPYVFYNGSLNPTNYGKITAGGRYQNDIANYTDNSGKDQAHNNIQPYITTYMWKRVS